MGKFSKIMFEFSSNYKKNLINILKKTSKTQFENGKTQFENITTQKTAQVVAWNSLDRRTKISPDAVCITNSLLEHSERLYCF